MDGQAELTWMAGKITRLCGRKTSLMSVLTWRGTDSTLIETNGYYNGHPDVSILCKNIKYLVFWHQQRIMQNSVFHLYFDPPCSGISVRQLSYYYGTGWSRTSQRSLHFQHCTVQSIHCNFITAVYEHRRIPPPIYSAGSNGNDHKKIKQCCIGLSTVNKSKQMNLYSALL